MVRPTDQEAGAIGEAASCCYIKIQDMQCEAAWETERSVRCLGKQRDVSIRLCDVSGAEEQSRRQVQDQPLRIVTSGVEGWLPLVVQGSESTVGGSRLG